MRAKASLVPHLLVTAVAYALYLILVLFVCVPLVVTIDKTLIAEDS